jgi:hypothetical protein
MKNIISRIKNSVFIETKNILPLVKTELNTFTSDAKKYLQLSNLLGYIHDIKPRIGTFNNPFRTAIPNFYLPAEFTFTKKSLSDIADQRAIELIATAKRLNKKIIIMWSGGINSTFVLTAFLKNISQADQTLVTVACSSSSILENTEFYLNFLSNNEKIHLTNVTDIHINNTLLDNNIVLHGALGDEIFGPFIPMHNLLEPWKQNTKTIINLFEPTLERDGFVEEGLGKWWFDIVTRTLEESGQSDYVSSVADWWWWTYYNFKWHNDAVYPLINRLHTVTDDGITLKNQNEFLDTAFFNTLDFQSWTYSNLKELYNLNTDTVKIQAKEYIYQFDKNFVYFIRKKKTKTPPPTFKLQKGNVVGYDQEFKPIFGSNLHSFFITLFTRYKLN